MANTYENFPQKEIACRCGCGSAYVADSFMIKIQTLRYRVGFPIITSCICRCHHHNLDVGGSPTSSHRSTPNHKCCAGDVSCTDPVERMLILAAAVGIGFRRIGVYKWGFHLDDDPTKPEACWYG